MLRIWCNSHLANSWVDVVHLANHITEMFVHFCHFFQVWREKIFLQKARWPIKYINQIKREIHPWMIDLIRPTVSWSARFVHNWQRCWKISQSVYVLLKVWVLNKVGFLLGFVIIMRSWPIIIHHVHKFIWVCTWRRKIITGPEATTTAGSYRGCSHQGVVKIIK